MLWSPMGHIVTKVLILGSGGFVSAKPANLTILQAIKALKEEKVKRCW